jgi:predicted ATPase with chaperone activity
VGVRVWGVVEDRLIELCIESGSRDAAEILGLPEDRRRETIDRVRAAVVNAGLLSEVPAVTVRLDPEVGEGPSWDLDLPLAIAWLAASGLIDPEVRWVFAAGRLGLDGSVWSDDLEGPVTISSALSSVLKRGRSLARSSVRPPC